jgi:hypothetical protein
LRTARARQEQVFERKTPPTEAAYRGFSLKKLRVIQSDPPTAIIGGRPKKIAVNPSPLKTKYPDTAATTILIASTALRNIP